MSKKNLGEIITIYKSEQEESKKQSRKLDYAIGILCEYGSNDWTVFNPSGRGFLFIDKSIDTSKFQTNDVVYYYTDKSTIKNEIDETIYVDEKGEYQLVEKNNIPLANENTSTNL